MRHIYKSESNTTAAAVVTTVVVVVVAVATAAVVVGLITLFWKEKFSNKGKPLKTH
jgi:NADH:ubiquinone oxidoreductase subunit K